MTRQHDAAWNDESMPLPPHAPAPPLDAGPGDAEEVAAKIWRFSSPVTRILLSGDGLTTTLLGALVGGPVRITDVSHRRVPAAEAPPGAVALLLAPTGTASTTATSTATATATTTATELLLRRSVTRGGCGSGSGSGCGSGDPLSVNLVLARTDLPTAVSGCLTDAATPLGTALHAAGTGLRRTILDAGRVAWPHPSPRPEGGRVPAPAAFKTYLLWHGQERQEPMAVIREVFGPHAVPAALRPAQAHAPAATPGEG